MGAGRCPAHLDRTCSVVHQSACSSFRLVGPTLESLAAFGGLVRCSSPLQTWLLRGRRSASHAARFLLGHWAPPPVHGLHPSLGTITSTACGLGCSQIPVGGFSTLGNHLRAPESDELSPLRRSKSITPPCGVSLPQRRLCNGEATSLSGGWAAVLFTEKTFSAAGACGLLDSLRFSIFSLGRGCSGSRVTVPLLVRRHSG
jgi:hypothetical protein